MLVHVTLRLLACDEPQGRVGVFGPGKSVGGRKEVQGWSPLQRRMGPAAGWLKLGRPLASQPAAASDEAVAQLASHNTPPNTP